MSQKIKTSVEIDGSLTASQIANATTDTDKFLVSDGGTVKYRTGAELASDLGIASGSTSKVQHQVKAGVAINKGQAVYVTSADGTNMIVGLASNASEATSSKTMGLLNATVVANGFADVITEGLLDGLDTSTATVGNPVWLGTGGNLIYGLANKPYAPNHLVFIGIVTRVNANNGEIFVKVQNGFELDEIHDVDLKTTTKVNGHLLGYNGSLWVNKTIAEWLGYTPYNASNPAGYISSYTETDTLQTVTDRGSVTTNPITINSTSLQHLTLNNRFNLIGSENFHISNNAYYSSGFKYKFAGNASKIALNSDNSFVFQTALTGTPDAAVTFENKFWADSAGNALSTGSMRSPIFYDYNDTSYYVDPSSTSNLNALTLLGAFSAPGYNKTNWDTAFGWGNHASAGYITQSTGDSRYIMGTTSPANVNNFTISIGNNGSYSYVQSHSSQPLELNPLGNDVRITGNTALHAGNYSSYAVPTSRTITINGTSYDLSANRSWTVTASETDTLATVTARGNSTSSPISVNSVTTTASTQANATLGTIASSWGGISYPTLYGSATDRWVMHINPHISYTQNGVNGFTGSMVGSTVRMASDTIATHYWDIGVGTNNVGIDRFSIGRNATNFLSINNSGNVISSIDMRSPIFYDSNDTSYYIDANNSSNLNVVSANRYISNAINNTGGLALNNASTYWGLVYNAGANDWRLGYGASNSAVEWNLRWDNGNTVWANGSMRAPIFYDSNDTTYYGDFNSTTRQYQAISFGDSSRYSAINTTINGAGAGDKLILYGGVSNYDARLLVGADYDMLFKSQGNSAGKGSFKFYSGQNCNLAMTIDGSQYTSLTGGLSVAGNSSWFGGYGASSGLAFENQSSFARVVFWNLDFYEWDSGQIMTMNNGYVQANNSFRAPIFYDSSDTGYYWNPATDASHRFQTPYGYIDIGPKNTSYCHIYTDRGSFYFNQQLDVLGNRVLHAGNYSNYAWPLEGGWKPASLASSTRLRGATSPDGGEFGLAYSGGQIHPYADGFFYQNEGAYRVMDSNSIGDYTVGNYRTIADYSSDSTWYMRPNGRFVFANAHDWTQTFELFLPSGGSNNNTWAHFGQRTSNTTNGNFTGVSIRRYINGSSDLGNLQAGNIYGRVFYDDDNNGYFLDLSSTGKSAKIGGYLETYASANKAVLVGNWNGANYWGFGSDGAHTMKIDMVNPDATTFLGASDINLKLGANTVWHTGNDGSGSGLDADLIDGIESSRIVYGGGASKISSHANANEWRNSGFYENDGGGSNWPSGTWYNSINVRHSNQGNYHGFQVAMSYYDNNLWFRSYNGSGTFQGWQRAAVARGEGTNYIDYSRYVYNNGAYSGSGWVEPSDLGVRYALNSTNAGNADTVDGFHGDTFFRNLGFGSGYPSWDANTIDESRSGFTYANGAPHNGCIAHFGASGYGIQLNGNYGGDTFAMRSRNGDNGTWRPWKTLYTDYNMDAPNKSGTSYYQTNTWMQLNGAYGLYCPSVNAAHFYPNNSSYGAWKIEGTRNGWGGLEFANGSNGSVSLMIGTNSANTGFHNNSYGWQLRWGSGTLYSGRGAYGGDESIVLQEDKWINNKYFGSGGEIYTTILLDSNDSSRYVDPSSTGDSIRVSGDVVAYYSDERLKDRKGNIENALDKVLSLNGFYYTPNARAQELGYLYKEEVGVSAQEVEAILPEIIKDAPIGHGYKTLNYGKLTPLLIEAIKEQQTQIEELKELVKILINK